LVNVIAAPKASFIAGQAAQKLKLAESSRSNSFTAGQAAQKGMLEEKRGVLAFTAGQAAQKFTTAWA
jgi:hypothetical protein